MIGAKWKIQTKLILMTLALAAIGMVLLATTILLQSFRVYEERTRDSVQSLLAAHTVEFQDKLNPIATKVQGMAGLYTAAAAHPRSDNPELLQQYLAEYFRDNDALLASINGVLFCRDTWTNTNIVVLTENLSTLGGISA